MKLCKLKLKNLNSFRREIEIDFEKPPLDEALLVAITGPTGAGKTTLLDAICVALYGKTPRLSGQTSQHPSHLISHGEREGFAEAHFEANGTRYIAAWSVRQKGTPRVDLRYAEDNKLISNKLSTRGKSLGSSQKTVSEEVESILGLDFDAFRRSVMLAQGEFAAFLKADSEDRRKILEATAGIHIYDVLRQALLDKIREVEAANEDVLDKLRQIPEASHEQLSEAESELEELKEEAKALNTQSQQMQQDKQRETKRKEDYKKLQFSEERQAKLLDLQPEIDALQTELENAVHAVHLRTEKREFDNTRSQLEKAKKALGVATTEKTEAEERVETYQTDFNEKDKTYQTASTEHRQKVDIYTAAKLDVERATDQFAEADDRTPKLVDLDDEIDTLSDRVTNRETEQAGLQEQIDEAQTFLNENHLPANRQQRLADAKVLLAQLDSQRKQLETAMTNEAEHDKKVASLRYEIERLSEIHTERFSKKTEAEDTLNTADNELNRLQAARDQNEWNTRKQQAVKARPIAEKYETATRDLTESENRLSALNNTRAELEAELDQIDGKLVEQERIYQRATEVVQHCEEKRELALLANPINKLRQRLQPGEPCQVCGSTDHSFVHIAESEDDDLLRNAEDALEHAETELQTAQNQMQTLKTKQIETQRDKGNTLQQIKDCNVDMETLQDEMEQHLAAWEEIYPDADVSSEWATTQIEQADTATAALGDAEQTRTTASHAYDMASQQLETCENDFVREEKSLKDIEEQLQAVNDTIADLQADIASIEERFWKFLPDTFHGVAPNEAVNAFSDKIDEVATHKDELDTAETNLKLLNAKIETDHSSLETLRNNRDDLQDEIGEYRREGEAFLNAVREKTDGLKTEGEIDAAIKQLEADLKAKEEARDKTNDQLQESQKILTQKETTHENADGRHEECKQKFETARDAYFNKLEDAGFNSPEAHDNAFRDETQLKQLTDHIKAHEDEKHQLALEIIQLTTRFEETPFDPEALERIETKAEEIAEQLQVKQQEVGAQQQRIDDLKDALEKREALGGEIAEAEAELMRWKRLQETIPRNDLRDFALEIMFRKMGSLANDQLKFLTSERYQLKVETIGDLSVIDRWNANEERPVETLSGGESFLTSLALALALADLSRGRAQLNSLFLDEGFGTLDRETLDIAISALEGLRMQGRSIFLISHIQELTRRLPVKINVKKQGSNDLNSSFSSDIDIRD